jgi:hypothetical protein
MERVIVILEIRSLPKYQPETSSNTLEHFKDCCPGDVAVGK